MRARPIIFWVFGSFLIFLAVFFISGVNSTTLGRTMATTVLAYAVAFILILLGGMFWISIMYMK